MSKADSKHITKLPDHDKKANLNDLTMGDRYDDEEMNIVKNGKGKP